MTAAWCSQLHLGRAYSGFRGIFSLLDGHPNTCRNEAAPALPIRVALDSQSFFFPLCHSPLNLLGAMVPGHAPPSKPGLDPASHRISLNIRALFPPSSPRLNPTQAPVHTLYFRKCFRNTIPLALICHCSFYARARSFFFQNKWLVIERKKGPS